MAQFVIQENDQARILTLCRIAQTNRSSLSVAELSEALTTKPSVDELESAWRSNSVLSSLYTLESGWILDRATGQGPSERGDVEIERKKRASMNLRLARELASLCADPRVRMMALSGGNSYGRAAPGDDIDLFCITRTDSLWLFMLKALILARVYRLNHKGSPQFCFSYVIDEKKARNEFRSARDGLFARDALMAQVLSGSAVYGDLIRESTWMAEYFPHLYETRARMRDTPGAAVDESRLRRTRSVVNSFLFLTVGSYIRLKAHLLNRTLRKSGRSSSIFHADVGEDRCVYESRRYQWLRKMYHEIEGELPG